MSLTALTLFALLVAGPQSQEVKIFDGKTLDGWTAIGGGTWEVKDGVIAGTSTPHQPQGVLLWKDPVKDFTARLKNFCIKNLPGIVFSVELLNSRYTINKHATRAKSNKECRSNV